MNIEQITQAIKDASDESDPRVGLEKIGKLREQIDRVNELAEARSRLLLRRVDSPNTAKRPSWFDSAFKDVTCVGEIDEIAKICIRTFLVEFPTLRAEVSNFNHGNRVSIDWQLHYNKRLQWVVNSDSGAIIWPGCSVYVLGRIGNGSEAVRETKLCHNVFDLIEFSKKFILS